MLSCQYGPKSLRNVSSNLLNLCQKELKQFWRQKAVQPGTSKVYLMKWPVCVYSCTTEMVGGPASGGRAGWPFIPGLVVRALAHLNPGCFRKGIWPNQICWLWSAAASPHGRSWKTTTVLKWVLSAWANHLKRKCLAKYSGEGKYLTKVNEVISYKVISRSNIVGQKTKCQPVHILHWLHATGWSIGFFSRVHKNFFFPLSLAYWLCQAVL